DVCSSDLEALAQEEIELVLQINGKLRGKLTVAASADKNAIEAAALASAAVRKVLAEDGAGGDAGGSIAPKVIIVPNRLVNVVLRRNPAQAKPRVDAAALGASDERGSK